MTGKRSWPRRNSYATRDADNVTVTRSQVIHLNEQPGSSGIGGNTVTSNTVSGSTNLFGSGGSTQNTNGLVEHNGFDSFETHILLVHDSGGAVVSNNEFRGTGLNQTGIVVSGTSPGTTISNNTVTPTGPGARVAIAVENQGGTLNSRITNNDLETRGVGIGLRTLNTGVFENLNVFVQGNTFVRNQTGVSVMQSSGATSPGNIDLGTFTFRAGVFEGSQGANDFRGFTGLNGHNAIDLTVGTRAGATVQAKNNIFDIGVDPTQVVAAAGHNLSGGTRSTLAVGAISPEAAEIQTQFHKVLGRRASLALGGELSAWLADLTSRGRFDVAQSILFSEESRSDIIEGYYAKFLNGYSSVEERAGWVEQLGIDSLDHSFYYSYDLSESIIRGVSSHLGNNRTNTECIMRVPCTRMCWDVSLTVRKSRHLIRISSTMGRLCN